jgi:hypothetical protein
VLKAWAISRKALNGVFRVEAGRILIADIVDRMRGITTSSTQAGPSRAQRGNEVSVFIRTSGQGAGPVFEARILPGTR